MPRECGQLRGYCAKFTGRARKTGKHVLASGRFKSLPLILSTLIYTEVCYKKLG